MRGEEPSVGRVVAQFALTGIAVVVLLGVIGLQVLRSTGQTEAIADAKRLLALRRAA